MFLDKAILLSGQSALYFFKYDPCMDTFMYVCIDIYIIYIYIYIYICHICIHMKLYRDIDTSNKSTCITSMRHWKVKKLGTLLIVFQDQRERDLALRSFTNKEKRVQISDLDGGDNNRVSKMGVPLKNHRFWWGDNNNKPEIWKWLESQVSNSWVIRKMETLGIQGPSQWHDDLWGFNHTLIMGLWLSDKKVKIGSLGLEWDEPDSLIPTSPIKQAMRQPHRMRTCFWSYPHVWLS